MPKRKRAKTNHPHSKNTANLSQAEIWDDSALIRSWNDAVAEYEYYHSIHARGEDVEEILRRAEMGESEDTVAAAAIDEPKMRGDLQDDKPEPASTAGEREQAEDQELEDGEVDDEPELVAAKAALTDQLYGSPVLPEGATLDASREKEVPEPRQRLGIPPATLPTIGADLHSARDEVPSPDQTLENIKMAYYWAGYYSGLHDGQHQAHAQPQPQSHPEQQPKPPET